MFATLQRMASCGTQVEWIDIHKNADTVREIGAEREFVRERLHVVDEQGELKIVIPVRPTEYS